MTIEENVPLAPYTTFHLGGSARYFARVQNTNISDLREAFAFAKAKGLSVFVLGGGSNVLVSDAGFEGLVIKIEFAGVEIAKEKGETLLIAAAGESWDALVAKAVQENLWGIENLSGIPGTVGGAVVQNIGAYGAALSQTLEWVEALDVQSGEVSRFSNSACKFGYRDSIFKQDEGRWVVVRAAVKLSKTPKPELSYKDLAKRFNDSSEDIMAIRNAVLGIRKGKFPDLSIEGTAGSFFKNPILAEEEAKKMQERYSAMPLFAMPEVSGVKIPLAWLLDVALGLKGLHVGGARLFEKQPLVIVAQKNARADDVKKLADEVQRQVREQIGITIEPEVKII